MWQGVGISGSSMRGEQGHPNASKFLFLQAPQQDHHSPSEPVSSAGGTSVVIQFRKQKMLLHLSVEWEKTGVRSTRIREEGRGGDAPSARARFLGSP